LSVPAARSSAGLAPALRAYSRISSPFGDFSASLSTSGCSGASTKKVAPNSVSARVVNTGMSMSSSSTRKRISAPSDRPIQLRCIASTRSGHTRSFISSSKLSA
jgi:hypothetical protein